jgi:hypothetical protein
VAVFFGVLISLERGQNTIVDRNRAPNRCLPMLPPLPHLLPPRLTTRHHASLFQAVCCVPGMRMRSAWHRL